MSLLRISEALGPDAARRVYDEAHAHYTDLGIADHFDREARAFHERQKTHVVVGDHQPEPRFNTDTCDSGDGSLVGQCKGAACRAHNRCCWQ